MPSMQARNDVVRAVLLGPPGAGKGTQAKLLSAETGAIHISTGEMFREAVRAGTVLGKQIGPMLDRGELLPDDLVIQVIEERFKQPDCANGFLLDGFPRTVPQAEALNKMLARLNMALTDIIFLDVSEKLLRLRLESREKDEGRADDSLESQITRFREYQAKTAPVILFYEREGLLRRVDGVGEVPQITLRIRNSLRQNFSQKG